MNKDDALIINLGQLAAISAGHPLRESVDTLDKGEITVVQMRDVRSSFVIDWNAAAKVTLPTKKEPKWLQNGDILLSSRGGKHSATLVEDVSEYAVCSPHFFLVRVHTAEIDPAFLCWQINQPPAQAIFQRAATGSSIPSLGIQAVKDLPIALPPVAQQYLITQFFKEAIQERDILEGLIKNRTKQLEAMAHGIFKNNLFQNKEPNGGSSD